MSDECAVCQTDVEGARLQLPCGHGFHASCIAEVFRRGDARCPLCRHNPYGDDSSSSGSTLFDFHHLEEMLTESAELRRRVLSRARRGPPKLRARWQQAKQRSVERWRAVRAHERAFERSAEYKRLVRLAAGADRSERAAAAHYVAPVLASMPPGDVAQFRAENPDFSLYSSRRQPSPARPAAAAAGSDTAPSS